MTALQGGSTLGRYQIAGEIGHGGMSVVYRAHDPKLKRDVAVKVMHAFLAEQADARERFSREAVAVARLRHPHIIEVFDYSDDGDQASYIVAELVDGQSLSELLGKDPVTPPEAALVLGRPIADALCHAHQHDVIHRDLKPENILVGRNGDLKLTDFGISRMLDNETMTVTGTLLGSPAYMAPEYIDGQDPDARADIFSFGAMLYQFAVGSLPFSGPSPHALLKRIASAEFRPANQVNPQIHAALARLIHRCLERDPDARFQTSEELLQSIDALLDRWELDADANREQFLQNPKRYGESLRTELKEKYFDLGRAALHRRQLGMAMDDFDRVLSLDPDHREVRRILDRMARRAFLVRGARLTAMGLAGAGIVTSALSALMGRPFPVQAPEPTPEPTPSTLAPKPPKAPAPGPRNVIFRLQGEGALSIDGEVVASTASGDFAHLLEPGEHTVVFTGKERTVKHTFTVPEKDKIMPIPLDVAPQRDTAPTRPPPPEKQFRDVAFTTKTVVQIYVDDEAEPRTVRQGNRLTTTPAVGPFFVRLSYGNHRLRFFSEYFQPKTQEIVVSDDDPPTRIKIELLMKPAYLRLLNKPPGLVEVQANGQILGHLSDAAPEGPVRVPLQPKSLRQEIVCLTENKPFFRKRVRFKPGQTETIDLAGLIPPR